VQVFARAADTYLRLAFLLFVLLVVGGLLVAGGVVRSEWMTGANFVVTQPIPFSHEHHAGTLGIDCRYCHDTVETSATAGYPPTYTCMSCHSQIWTGAAMLAPVRQSLVEDRPLAWKRVYKLPDYVYFDHSAHVVAGVGCSSCHGRVDQMPLIRLAQPLQMQWCLGCHRDPAPSLRAPEEVFDMAWQAPPNQVELGRDRMLKHHVEPRRLTDCYVCHR
jgi:hypothetical protein